MTGEDPSRWCPPDPRFPRWLDGLLYAWLWFDDLLRKKRKRNSDG